MPGPRPRQVWGAGVVVAAVGLVVLVAVAADQAPFDVSSDSGTVHWPKWLAGLVAVTIAVAVLCGLVVVIASLTQGNKVGARTRRRSTLAVILLAAAMILLLLLLPKGKTTKDPPAVAAPCVDCVPRTIIGHDGTAVFVVLLVATIVAALGLAAYGSRRLRATAAPTEADGDDDHAEPTATLAAVERSLADLGGPLDDRAAVIAAYATLLEGLAAAGCRRRPAEAPDELVVRALSSLRVREAPLRLLTGLFNEARFSTHDLGPAERRQAIVALEQARDDLRSLIDASTTHPVG